MNLLVAGGTGFIGQRLVEESLERGWRVTALVRPGHSSFLPRPHGAGDLHVLETCHNALEPSLRISFDALVNLVGPGADSWTTNWQGNVEYVRRLADALKRTPVARVVHFSSVAVYGPSARGRGAILREDDPLSPDDWYGTTKLLGERIWREFHNATGIPVTILRPSWVIGRGSRLLDKYLLRAAQSGVVVDALTTAPLNVVYVKDVARAALTAASKDSRGVAVYNLNLPNQRFGDFLRVLRQEVPGFKIPLYVPSPAVRLLAARFGSLRFLVSGVRVDVAKAESELDFAPQYDVRSAVREMVTPHIVREAWPVG